MQSVESAEVYLCHVYDRCGELLETKMVQKPNPPAREYSSLKKQLRAEGWILDHGSATEMDYYEYA